MAMTRGRKILLGCLVAGAGLITGLVLAVVLALVWLRSPGPDLDIARLLDAETGFFLELRLRREDSGARDLFRVFAEAQRQPVEIDLDQAPPWAVWVFAGLEDLGNQEVDDTEIDKALPAALIITAQQDRGGGPAEPLFVAHLPMTGRGLWLADRFLGWFLPRDSRVIHRRHKEETYLRLPDELPVWLSIVGTDVLFALREEPVISGIDRLARAPEDLGSAPLAAILTQVPAGAALRLAALPGQAQALVPLVEPLAPEWSPALELLLRDAGEARAWGALESADVLAGEIEISRGGGALLPRDETTTGTLTLERGPVRFVLRQPPAGGTTWRFRLEGLETLVRQGSSRLRQGEGIRIPSSPD